MLAYIGYSITHMTAGALPDDFPHWPELNAYGSKTIDNWAKPDKGEGKKAWAAFDAQWAIEGAGVVDKVWMQVGMVRDAGWAPTRIMNAAITVIGLARQRIGPDMPIFVSGMSGYEANSAGDLHADWQDCNLAVSRLVDLGLPNVHAGPLMAELTPDLIDSDGIHPNADGAAILAACLTEFDWTT